MGSFYVNVRDGQTLTRDPTPYQFSTIEVARDSVIQAVRDSLCAGDETLDERRIEIADGTGHPVSFVDAFDVQPTKLRLRQPIPAARRELKL